MDEKTKEALRVQFDKRLRLESHGARITSDAGLLACREFDGALELTEVDRPICERPEEAEMCSMRSYRCCGSRCIGAWAGYEDTNDPLRLAMDPAMQAMVGRRALEKQAASANTLTLSDGF